MNDDKELSSQCVNEDWWFQYLSEEEKIEQKTAGLLSVEAVPNETAQPRSESNPTVKRVVMCVRKHAPKVAAIVGITSAIVHWGVVNLRLHKLENVHQLTLETLESSGQMVDFERELVAQKSKTLEGERSRVEKIEEELALSQQQMETQSKGVTDELDRWKTSLHKVVMLSQDIYALKTEARHGSLMDLENEKERENQIRKLWTEIGESLKNYDEFESERALIKLRVIQSQALSGEFSQQELDSIDWKTADMEREQATLLIRIYYKQARNLLSKDEKVEAEALVESCMKLAKLTDQRGSEESYILAMLSKMNGDLSLKEQPKEALKSYLIAVESLKEVIEEEPASAALRNQLAQLCQDLSVVPSIEGNRDCGDKLKQETLKQASWLVERYSEYKSAHLILAQLDISAAEECLRNGELAKVDDLLERSHQSLERGGGDVVMQSWIDGMHAFMAWNKGYRTSATKLMNTQVSKLLALVENEPVNAAARSRCAALLWVRSMMQLSEDNARSDGLKALECLSSVITGPGSLHEMSARRMSAIILCDLAEMEMESGSETKARDYLIRSGKLWAEMRLKWGLPDEDRELVNWCAHQLTLL